MSPLTPEQHARVAYSLLTHMEPSLREERLVVRYNTALRAPSKVSLQRSAEPRKLIIEFSVPATAAKFDEVLETAVRCAKYLLTAPAVPKAALPSLEKQLNEARKRIQQLEAENEALRESYLHGAPQGGTFQ
jgi:hypothetical protein